MIPTIDVDAGPAGAAPEAESLPPTIWIPRYCTLWQPGLGPSPLRPYPYQMELWQDDARQRIVLKSRQMGVSLSLACEAAWMALNQPGSTVLLVSRSLAAARNLLRYAWQGIESAVRSGDLPRPSVRNAISLEWEMLQSRLISLPASIDAARSFSATAVYLDEAAYLPWAEEIYQSLAPTVSTGGRMTVVSTPHGRGNLFHRLWECEVGWSRHSVHWSRRPDYTREWAHAEQARHTARSWAEEYELNFESSGQNVFQEEHIQALIRPAVEPEAPYFAGLDLARYRDYTVLAILDHAGRLARLERFNQATWTLQVERVAGILQSYPDVRVECDSTGAGDPVFELLQNKAGSIRPQPFFLFAFVYTSESRQKLMDDFSLAVEQHRIAVPDPGREESSAGDRSRTPVGILLGEMRAFQWDDTTTGKQAPRHPPGGHDDCIQALALAWRSLLQGKAHPAHRPLALVATGRRSPQRW